VGHGQEPHSKLKQKKKFFHCFTLQLTIPATVFFYSLLLLWFGNLWWIKKTILCPEKQLYLNKTWNFKFKKPAMWIDVVTSPCTIIFFKIKTSFVCSLSCYRSFNYCYNVWIVGRLTINIMFWKGRWQRKYDAFVVLL